MIARILLGVEGVALRRQLKDCLVGDHAVVEVVRGRQRVWQRVREQVCDLIVISRDRLPPPATESVAVLAGIPEAPAVVVITDEDDAEDRALLLAAGCKAVLDASTPTEALSDALRAVLAQQQQVAQELLEARRRIDQPRLSDFVSNSGAMREFVHVARRVAKSDVSVLILGETGVGKERLAQALHHEGARAGGPFIAINCGALPETLLESELFGHEVGAFTGATRGRRGCFELGHGGTVFLDEVGDIPLHLQVKLLRVLQEREIRRLGSERTLKVNARIMAATNRDLETEIDHGRFRRDLYYRLSVMTLEIPPLRARREDISQLAHNYVAYLRDRVGSSGEQVTQITGQAIRSLETYDWPGNIRELINVIERAMLLCTSETITTAQLPATIAGRVKVSLKGMERIAGTLHAAPAEWLHKPWRTVRQEVLQEVERAYLSALLHHTDGKVGETAHRAGMTSRSLHEKMKQYGLRKEDYRPKRCSRSGYADP